MKVKILAALLLACFLPLTYAEEAIQPVVVAEAPLATPTATDAQAKPESMRVEVPIPPSSEPIADTQTEPVGDVPVERIFWDRTPIRLSLRVGRERIIQFPGATLMQVGVPGKLNKGMLRTQIVDNTVYWLAHNAFKSERIQIVNTGTGETFLFDLEAKKGEGGTAPVEIISAIQKEKARSAKLKKEKTQAAKGQPYDYVSLTRFAAQQLYAPLRLSTPLPGMVMMQIEPDKKIALVRGGKVEAIPLMVWKAPGLYVAAVRLKNATPDYVTLDPRDLRGDWLAATFQHVRLMPAGDEADTTCVYLIAKQNPISILR